ncbi:MAG: hypothetical protein EHM49_00880, partial [Deltaproteobacteria bacterium]
MAAESFQPESYLANIEGVVEGKFASAENYADLAWNIAEGLISEMSTAAANWNFDWPMWGCNIGGLADVSPPTQPDKVDLEDLGITLPTCDPLEAITIEDIDIPACSVVSPIITIPEEP